MGALKVGIREFREKLADYLLESDTPIAITRHGETVGFYIPARRNRTDADREAFRVAAERFDREMAALGLDEEELMRDAKQFRKSQKNR